MTSPTPWASMISVHATPAAPAPTTTTVTSSGRLPTSLSALSSAGEDDDRRAVLVVVEDRDVELVAQPPLDLEAARGRDVLEVDAAEGRRGRLDEGDDLVDVLAVDAEREGVDAGELLEEHRLALHHRHGRLRADVAEAEHRGPVGDDGDHVALDGQRPGLAPGRRGWPCRRGRRPACRPCDRSSRVLSGSLPLTSILPPLCMRNVRSETLSTCTPSSARTARTTSSACSPSPAGHGDVAHDLALLHAHEVDGAEHRLRLGDRLGDVGERAPLLRKAQAHGEAVGGGRLKARGSVGHADDSRAVQPAGTKRTTRRCGSASLRRTVSSSPGLEPVAVAAGAHGGVGELDLDVLLAGAIDDHRRERLADRGPAGAAPRRGRRRRARRRRPPGRRRPSRPGSSGSAASSHSGGSSCRQAAVA